MAFAMSKLPAMSKRLPIAVLATLAGIAIIAGCGSSDSSATANSVVVHEGNVPITRAVVNHWMQIDAAGDYYSLSHERIIPAGLVSDPPNYPRCVSVLQGIIERNHRTRTFSKSQLVLKCGQIYRAVKAQATSQLVTSYWLTGIAREFGYNPTDTEEKRLFKEICEREFPTKAAFTKYLAERHMSLADELFEVKLDLIRQKVSLISGRSTLHSFTKQGLHKILAVGQRLSQKTICTAGYIVEHCKEYTLGTRVMPNPPASVLMEQVAALVTGVCINTEACASVL
jgi:hypothetical protein